MSRVSFRSFLAGIGLAILAACAPFQGQGESVGAEEVKAQVGTSVALTIAAHYTNQAAHPPATPTVTVTPTLTLTPFPTLTPHTPPPTQLPGGGAPGPAAYGCAVTGKVPYDNAILQPNTDFDIKFYLKNIGAKPWGAGADLLYGGGTDMLVGNTRYELPQVSPGQQVGPFIFDAHTPKKPGTYVMTFKVQGGFCYPYVRVVVKR
ncbi:MAG: hypothetical protein HFACDABA_02313 [Anaerolineales bacterium]|nr:hypothetical protein [Anaerolineales bacterium]